MRVIHSTWDASSNELCIWAENAQKINALSEASNQNSNESLSLHPFSSSSEELDQDLEILEFFPEKFEEIRLQIPSDSVGPLASPSLLTSLDIQRDDSSFPKHWSVPSGICTPVSALGFLSGLPENPSSGLALGESTKFWVEATKFLLQLLSQGKFLPNLTRGNACYVSCWSVPRLSGEDQIIFHSLAEAMPSACYAKINEDGNQVTEAKLVLESFLSTGADSLIRAFLKNQPLVDVESLTVNPAKFTPEIAWLKSLNSNETTFHSSITELESLEQRLRKWNGFLLTGNLHDELTLGFRLIAPLFDDDENETWQLKFMVCSKSKAKQAISARELWLGELGAFQNSNLSLEEIEETFLKDLAKASHDFPPIERSLQESFPTEIELSSSEAYVFLKETSVILENQGYRVYLPSWWNTQSTHLGLHLEVTDDDFNLNEEYQPSLVGMHSLLNYSWKIAIGSQMLSAEQFKTLASAQTPLIQVDGQWVELEPKKVAAALLFLEKQSALKQISAFEALRLAFGARGNMDALPIVGITASGWLKRLISDERSSIQLLPQPASFIGSLRPYQLEGLSWMAFLTMAGVGGCLADDMGLGKTIQLLTLLIHERDQGLGKKPTLLVVPMSILDNWEREAKKFAPELKVYIHHGPNRAKGARFRSIVSKMDLVLTTYSLGFRDEAEFSQVAWERIALDEAQNIKNLGTKQTQAIRRIANAQADIIGDDGLPHFCHRLALTGTPLENHLEELWSIFDFLNPNYLGTLTEFRRTFAAPIERYRDKEAADKLAKLVQPFILRRLKTDPKVIDELPEKIEVEELISLTKEQIDLYNQTLNSMIAQVDGATGIHRKGLVLQTITRLKQICDHPALLLKDNNNAATRSGKLTRLEELIDTILAEGDQTLIFTQYAQMGHIIKAYLQEKFNREVLFLHGALQKSARNKMIDRFQNEKDCPIFVLSLMAGGFGLNLTAANQVIHYDQWWNPAVEEQATDRAFRIGQKRNVQVRKFICKGTLEDKIAELVSHKRNLVDQIVGSTKNSLTQLSTEDLHNLLQLSSDSLREFDDV